MSESLSDLTPIHIRGKRSAVNRTARPAKRIRPQKTPVQSATQGSMLSSSLSTPIYEPASTRGAAQPTRLENLPTELLEIILFDSRNCDLPLVSRTLLRQLSGARMVTRMMAEILRPILCTQHDIGTDQAVENLKVFERFLSCRFCTWPSLKQWVMENRINVDDQTRARFEKVFTESDSPSIQEIQGEGRVGLAMSMSLHSPAQQLHFRLPEKLLHGPWTGDRLGFLAFCATLSIGTFPSPVHAAPQFLDRLSANNAFNDALQENSYGAVHMLICLGLVPESDYMRTAIMVAECDVEIIDELLRQDQLLCHSSKEDERNWPTFDPLDPIIWQWADAPKQVVSGRGEWTKQRLREHHDACMMARRRHGRPLSLKPR